MIRIGGYLVLPELNAMIMVQISNKKHIVKTEGRIIRTLRYLPLIAFILFCVFIPPTESFDAGGLPMKGQIIMPLEDVNVKLDVINIYINKTDRKTISKYVLRNLENNIVSFKVAYPVESEPHGDTYISEDFKVTVDGIPVKHELIRNLQATVAPIEYEAGYVWTITLNPLEKKEIQCIFDLGGYVEPWLEILEYSFYHLTSWKGKPDSVVVSFSIGDRLIDNLGDAPTLHGPAITITPGNYKLEGDTLKWIYENSSNIADIDVSIDWRGHRLEPSPENKFEGEIIYDRRNIYKIKGNDPAREILLAEKGANAKWSPNGDLIAYFHKPTWDTCQLYIMNYSGEFKKKIKSVKCSYDISWDASGEIIYLNDSYRPERSYNIKTNEFTDIDRSIYSTPECKMLSLSPDNNTLLCQNNIGIGDWTLGIFKMTKHSVGKIQKIYAKIRKDRKSIIYQDKEYTLVKELNLTNSKIIRWTHDGEKFVITDEGQLFFYDKNVNQISRYESKPNIQDWSKDESKLIYCSTCGAEGAIGKLIMIDLKNGNEYFIASGQNLDWFVHELSGISAIKRIFNYKINYEGNKRLYSETDLNNELVVGKNDDHKLFVRTLRNEIFARYGRKFSSADLQEIFTTSIWYVPNDEYSDNALNDHEKENINIILKFEKQKGW